LLEILVVGGLGSIELFCDAYY